MLLPDKPPFAPQGNFKEGYVAELRRVRKNVQRFFTGKLGREEMFPIASSKLPEGIGVDDALSLCFDYRYDWTIEGKVSYNERTLPHALLHINPDFLPDYHPTVIALYQILCPTIIRRSLPYTKLFSVRCTCWTRGRWLHSCSDCRTRITWCVGCPPTSMHKPKNWWRHSKDSFRLRSSR